MAVHCTYSDATMETTLRKLKFYGVFFCAWLRLAADSTNLPKAFLSSAPSSKFRIQHAIRPQPCPVTFLNLNCHYTPILRFSEVSVIDNTIK